MRRSSFLAIAFLMANLLLVTACKEDPMASVSFNEVGDTLGGDVTGDGGSTTRTYTWNNSLPTADYNMDITASAGGSFNLRITDPTGKVVLDQTLVVGQGDDSKSGVTTSGAAGNWTVTITLTDFDGDGSFSLSPGN